MPSLFHKLNLKDQNKIVVLNAPNSFEPELAALFDIAIVHHTNEVESALFVLAFLITQHEVTNISEWVSHHTSGDAVIWFAYPKSSSKIYKCDFNRDTGWSALGQAGFEPVRIIAIDNDWSALRFRRVEYIKTMKRRESMALSETGKKRVSA